MADLQQQSTIRILRDRAGLSQSDVATELAVSEAYLSRVERGLRTPSVPVLHRLLGILKASDDERLAVMAEVSSRSAA